MITSIITASIEINVIAGIVSSKLINTTNAIFNIISSSINSIADISIIICVLKGLLKISYAKSSFNTD